jgi:hypothetical protein
MKDNTKSVIIRILCWIFVVILPVGVICWLMDLYSVAMLAVAFPFFLVAERVYRKLLQHYNLWEVDANSTDLTNNPTGPGTTRNGDSAAETKNIGVTEGPPSVS